ncbi:UNVERIFIED_CONTAM: hypothetical protein GTU68_007151 [Idotea baltica]|nr:hypothetical protein [Idotea baltica]
MTFKDLGLSSAILKAVEEKGYTKPSPIQEKAIPPILEGKDILASAQTGTGKTAGFTLPVLQYLTATKHPKYRPLRALVLTPTRELAAQVYDNVREYSKYLDIKSAVIFGGVNAKPQIATLRRGVDILVATPGRLLDLHDQKAISAAAIHGNKSQGARTKALKSFKENSIKILVATDIAARGLDIPLLPHVINYELPNVPEDYVHRIGRTGRAGAAGEAISLVCSEETEYQKEIEKLLNEKLKSTVVEGFEPTDTTAPKRAATQSKGSFGKKKKAGNSESSQGNKPKRKPHFKGKKPTNTSGRGRTGAPKKKRY